LESPVRASRSGRRFRETMGGEAATKVLLVFGLELIILYAAGSYAMGRLMAISGFGGGGIAPGRLAFFVLVLPGVVLHESAHYLACLLTGTKVSRFAAFSPRRSADGRLVLGYVRHERRGFPIGAIIGLAPVLLNPLGILLVTALLTPLTFSEVAAPSFATLTNRLAGGFLAETPLLAAVWAYLSLSLALGSVPSREDLSSLPAVLLVFVGGVFLLGLLRVGSANVFSAIHDLAVLAAGLYVLPAAVALVAALLAKLFR
jgi:hypothetical protein